ncbi:DUF1543 domain-containing protein [Flavobacterium sp. 3HN19-14]|uniref:DUF1543 domain-containing protein n=1 Tax=Flavobacterium sp. 3HN19-14 TaxID=3448133 RepID=UPI003EDF59C2
MELTLKLYMVILGATPPGRLTEQHDIFFGIGNSLSALVTEMKASWPEAKGKIHIDAWREVTVVDNHSIRIVPKSGSIPSEQKLFFINLGGYKPGEFEEYHYKVLAVGESLSEATKKSKATTFYKHFGFKGATSHIDDKYGIDIDDIYKVEDILHDSFKQQYALEIMTSEAVLPEDELHIGYVRIEKLIANAPQ